VTFPRATRFSASDGYRRGIMSIRLGLECKSGRFGIAEKSEEDLHLTPNLIRCMLLSSGQTLFKLESMIEMGRTGGQCTGHATERLDEHHTVAVQPPPIVKATIIEGSVAAGKETFAGR